MSADTILNILVALVAVNSIASARFRHTERQVKAAEFGASFVLTSVVTGLAAIVFWTWLAVETGCWQFAAIIAIPMLITVGSLANRKASR